MKKQISMSRGTDQVPSNKVNQESSNLSATTSVRNSVNCDFSQLKQLQPNNGLLVLADKISALISDFFEFETGIKASENESLYEGFSNVSEEINTHLIDCKEHIARLLGNDLISQIESIQDQKTSK